MTGMWMVIGLLALISKAVSGKPTGDHICQEERRYTVNVTEYFIRNSTVRNYEWCMHVPPRCSFYTTKLVNDSRIVEKEVVDFIDKCCPGYEEDKDSGTCVPVCPQCVNGTCKQGKCDCFPGYKGDYCDTDCDSTEWGRNCKFKCTCNHGSCDSLTGSCICPFGWTGNRCQSTCSEGFYGEDCKEKCSCKSDELCHYVTGECEASVTTTTITSTDKTTFSSLNTNSDPTKSYILNKVKIDKNNVLSFKNNGKFETDINGLLSTTSVLGIMETEFPVAEDQDKLEISKMPTNDYGSVHQFTGPDRDEQSINTLMTRGPVQVTKSSKAKVNVKEVSATEASHPHEENYLNDEAHRGSINQPPINKNDLVNSASAATAISVAVIIIAVVIVATNHFIRNKKKIKEGAERTKGMPTVSVYTHSIFHTPLPEPPTFENPIFITPIEANPNNEGQRIETRVVCSMNFPGHTIKDPREYLYDHPPSTGSYRAASIPEPPDVDTSSVQSLPHTEPLYDEIPSGMEPTPVSQPPSYKSSSLYMNTCGKTRL